jgi:hypothetical protein
MSIAIFLEVMGTPLFPILQNTPLFQIQYIVNSVGPLHILLTNVEIWMLSPTYYIILHLESMKLLKGSKESIEGEEISGEDGMEGGDQAIVTTMMSKDILQGIILS